VKRWSDQYSIPVPALGPLSTIKSSIRLYLRFAYLSRMVQANPLDRSASALKNQHYHSSGPQNFRQGWLLWPYWRRVQEEPRAVAWSTWSWSLEWYLVEWKTDLRRWVIYPRQMRQWAALESDLLYFSRHRCHVSIPSSVLLIHLVVRFHALYNSDLPGKLIRHSYSSCPCAHTDT